MSTYDRYLAGLGYDDYVAAQQSALATLVQENKQQILKTVGSWIGGTACAAVGLPPPVCQAASSVVVSLVGPLIDECTDVDRKNRTFEERLRASIASGLGDLPAIQSRPCPEGVQLIPNRVEVRAADVGQPAVTPLVIACDQDVTVRFDLLGHAASPCHQDMALVWIVGNQGGQGTVVWGKSVRGVARVFNPESKQATGEEKVRLLAGGYALIAAFTGDHSGAVASVDYASVPAPPPWYRQPWGKAALAGVGAGALAAAAAAVLVRR